jgi:putative flavoprotein involved in K+ transport
MHSSAYRNPGQLPGRGSGDRRGLIGVQIADELQRAGRKVYLSVGPHDRPPRAYRGRDFCWWLGVLGKWDMAAPAPGTEHVTISVSGAHGGETIDFRRLGNRGMTLVGRTEGYRDGVAALSPRICARNLRRWRRELPSLLDEADAYIARNGLDLPEEPQARRREPDPDCVTHPILELDLAARPGSPR